MVVHLPRKCKVRSSNTSAAKKKNVAHAGIPGGGGEGGWRAKASPGKSLRSYLNNQLKAKGLGAWLKWHSPS
jgi:hypothetical protein